MTFIPKNQQRIASLPVVHTVRGVKQQKGEVGIEIEVEGNQFPKHEYDGYEEVDPEYIPYEWVYHRDGSLRGVDNAEYVLRKPLPFNDVPAAVNNLWEMFSKYGTELDESNRTSVHVHLNVQQWHINRLCSFLALYYSVEEILTAYSGEHRVGNLFCLRAKDAPGVIAEVKEFFQANGKGTFSNGMHYAGLNVSPLHRFGSVEVRTMRGALLAEEVIDWVSILQRLYDISKEYPDPRRVVEGFSGEGAMAYFERVFGPHSTKVLNGCGMSAMEVLSSLHEGIRFAQDICYCTDWNQYDYIVPEKDPFGRKKSSSGLDQFMTEYQTMVTVTAASSPPLIYNHDIDLWSAS